MSYNLITVRPEGAAEGAAEGDEDAAVLETSELLEGPNFDWELEDPKVFHLGRHVDGWNPMRLWPDRPLPQVPPVEVIVPGPSASEDKLKKLGDLHKKQAHLLQDLGVQVPIEDQISAVDIPSKSKDCTRCGQSFSSHYRAVLHFRAKHLHQTKWQCGICQKFVTSQAILENHMQVVHVDHKFKCRFCKAESPTFCQTKQELEAHMKTHKRYQRAEKHCEYCLQVFVDVDSHEKTCRHNPGVKAQRFTCTNEGCDSSFSAKKHRNYHSKKRCPQRTQ